ncbi:response regulator transcription factor [Polaribacter sp. BAL334]|uniref:LytR/AlgR family response regulator transcription factor n=1 Tax=Polaribacter sp. BAL334 TaxID=1708178 RepID=UPI0018D26A63|nr:LytTR family DNA-binding domain-containing protein [Polaribacter sp. BAL334]MBG7611365.1 response regulator transcription factor [Polaribacter sp. BAL334]
MKILIIEDEPHNAQILSEIIVQLKPNSIILETLESVEQAVKYLSNHNNTPDLIFSDIQLADGLSFEIFSKIKIKCPIIFCTAYDQYTLQAFKTNGIEYILKPVKEEDIEAAFIKYDTLKESLKPDNEIVHLLKKTFSEKKNYKTSILVHYKESFIPIAVHKIAFFVVENEILYIQTLDTQRYPVFKTISEIESSIDPSLFFRINRQVLLNKNIIKEIQPYFNRKVIIITDKTITEQLIVSRLKVTEFMNWIEQS